MRPAQCSRTLRPARSADPQRGLSIEVLQIIRRLLIRSDRFRLEREFAGPDFHRGERCALPRHTEQSGREFASTNTAAGAQDAAPQTARKPSASSPLTLPSITLLMSSAILHPAPRSAPSEAKRSRRGGLRPPPEPEQKLPAFTPLLRVPVTAPPPLVGRDQRR